MTTAAGNTSPGAILVFSSDARNDRDPDVPSTCVQLQPTLQDDDSAVSHGGYDPKTGQFGTYRRVHTENKDCRPPCGKIKSIIKRYQDEYRLAAENVYATQAR